MTAAPPKASIRVDENVGIERRGEAVRLGVPLPRGFLARGRDASVVDGRGTPVPSQTRVLARWPDRSAKWLLVDFAADVGARATARYFVEPAASPAAGDGPRVEVATEADAVRVETGAAAFTIPRTGPFGLAAGIDGRAALARDALRLTLTDASRRRLTGTVERVDVEDAGPVRATLVVDGTFAGAGGEAPLTFRARLVFVRGARTVRLELSVRNPRAAQHAGNLWDLGDPGSYVFEDLSLGLGPPGAAAALEWSTDPAAAPAAASAATWTLYQDSSGGERWDSPNHVDAQGRSTVSFRGYEVRGVDGRVEARGERAQPTFVATTDAGWVAASVEHFWQNFPKALRFGDGEIDVGLFPAECAASFELQGGEQKRHAVLVEVGAPGDAPRIASLLAPVDARVEPQWIEAAGAVPYYTAPETREDPRLTDYLQSIVEGPRSFVANREVIDEYGWRNFGDLYADHEAVNWREDRPFISHYNNQYDFILAAGLRYLRTGDERWRTLMVQAARHTIDIDIYHTREDRPSYNGGLFWHTDHHFDAATCTHRTFSRRNGAGSNYGGGPSNEHNYTSGLLHYYYLTGDPEAREAVLELGRWVLGMDDGAATVFALFNARPTGFASRTVSDDWHKPGRGAGNSINALLDAYAVSTDRTFMFKAEELIRRCIHPADDVAALGLGEPEYRWSYLVFLQVLGKYLDVKLELGETDYCFYYARDSLLRYADWMLEHEVPYKDVLDKVLLPTETWPAQDVRKCHIFHLAARCATGARRDAFAERAGYFFDRCLTDLLGFETAHLTRPRVILSVYGPQHAYYLARERAGPADDALCRAHAYDFKTPDVFEPQRAGFKTATREGLRVSLREFRRLLATRLPGRRPVPAPGRRAS